jgi:hypothetical protein
MALRGPPAPLRILEQPLQLFWKDRGGKRNQLRCVVESPLPVTQVRRPRVLGRGRALKRVARRTVDCTAGRASRVLAASSVARPLCR